MPNAANATSNALIKICAPAGKVVMALPASNIEATLAWYSLPLIQLSREVGVSRRGAMPLAVMPTISNRPCSRLAGTRPSSTST